MRILRQSHFCDSFATTSSLSCGPKNYFPITVPDLSLSILARHSLDLRSKNAVVAIVFWSPSQKGHFFDKLNQQFFKICLILRNQSSIPSEREGNYKCCRRGMRRTIFYPKDGKHRLVWQLNQVTHLFSWISEITVEIIYKVLGWKVNQLLFSIWLRLFDFTIVYSRWQRC